MPPLSKTFADSKGPVQVYLSKEIKRSLIAFIESQRIKPSISEVGELAFQEFLEREGVYPLASSEVKEQGTEQAKPKPKPKRPSL